MNADGRGCGVCIAICPFSLAGYEKIQAGFLKAQAVRQPAAA